MNPGLPLCCRLGISFTRLEFLLPVYAPLYPGSSRDQWQTRVNGGGQSDAPVGVGQYYLGMASSNAGRRLNSSVRKADERYAGKGFHKI
jgi:hypothetical protein